MLAKLVFAFLGVLLVGSANLPAQTHPADSPGPWHLDDPAHLPGARPRLKAISEEQEAELLKVLEEKQPERHKRLMELREEHPRKYRRLLPRAWQWYQRWKALPPAIQKAHFRLGEIRLKAWRLVERIGRTDQPEKQAKLKEKLLEAVGEQFDLEQTLLKQRLRELAEALDRLRAKIDRRAADRLQIVQRRAEGLLERSPSPPEPEPAAPGEPDAD